MADLSAERKVWRQLLHQHLHAPAIQTQNICRMECDDPLQIKIGVSGMSESGFADFIAILCRDWPERGESVFARHNSILRAALSIIALLVFVCSMRIFAKAQSPGQAGSLSVLEAGWTSLAAGRPREAKRTFMNGLTTWADIGPSSSGYVDSERGLVLAYLFNLEDASARKYFTEVLSRVGTEPEGDALLFSGRFDDAIRSYRDGTQDNAVVNPVAGPDRVIAAGAEIALKGDMRGAIQAWNRPAVGVGPNDLTDIQVALIGIAYSRLGDWRNAERYWIAAVRTDRFVPQMAAMATGNIMALSMLIHYRSHFARGEGQYRRPR